MAYEFDQAHSIIEFAVKHMMVTTVKGRFKQFNGIVDIDEQNPAASVVNITIDVASVDTGNDGRDGHLRSPDFFDPEKYPTITFTSTKIEPLGGERYRVTGDLTAHGVTKSHTLEVTREGATTNMQGKKIVAFSLDTKLSRKEFGLEWNVALESGGWLVSDEVKVSVEAQVVEAAPVTA